MLLQGRVESAKVGNFFDIEVVVSDRQVVKPSGGRPQYTCRVVAGWPGVDELRNLRKALKQGQAVQQDVEAYAAQIALPQEDQMLSLAVMDIQGKAGYKTLICEVVGA